MALFVAAAAAYFSIYGLALIFSGAMIPVIIMASALEVGKLCATSVVYNYWKDLSYLMRGYLISAILVLMLITSGGIYGFLSSAYQQDQLPLEKITEKIKLLDIEYNRKVGRLKQMDDIISSISSNYISKRLEEKKQQRTEREQLATRINEIENEKLEISNKKIETESHIGPIIYIAKALNRTTDDAIHWLILLFVFAFDPLAVALTIVANMLTRIRKDKINLKNKKEIKYQETPNINKINIKDELEPDNIIKVKQSIPMEISSYSKDTNKKIQIEIIPEQKIEDSEIINPIDDINRNDDIDDMKIAISNVLNKMDEVSNKQPTVDISGLNNTMETLNNSLSEITKSTKLEQERLSKQKDIKNNIRNKNI
jgi:hypothetical protein